MIPRAVIWLLLLSACTTPAIIATKSVQEGDRMNNANRYDEAIANYEQYLKASAQLGIHRNPSQEADVCRKLSHAYATQGKYRKSFGYLSKALGIDSTLSTNGLQVIDDYRELGIVNAYMGDYKEAMHCLHKSLALSEGMQNSSKDIKKISLADTYLSLAQVHLTLGNFREASQYGEKALALYQHIPGEATGRIECGLLLGLIERDRGNLQKAMLLIRDSEKTSVEQGLNTARQHQALGEIHFLRGESEEGIREKMLAIDEAEKSRIKPQMVMMYIRMGDAYQKLGDQLKAEYFYQKAMAVKIHMDSDTLGFVPSSNMRFAEAEKAYDYYSRTGATMGIALASLRLGELRLQKNDADSALIMFNSALDAFNRAGSNEGIAKTNLELASIYIGKKEYTKASEHLRLARSVTNQPDILWQVELRAGIIAENTGSINVAYASYRKAISIIDGMRASISIEEFKTLFANTKVAAYDRLINLLLNKKPDSLTVPQAVEQAFHYNEQSRSRTFLDMLGNKKIEAKQTADTALLEKEQLLRLKIRQLARREGNPDNNSANNRLAEDLEEAYREYDVVLSALKLNNPAYSTMINVQLPPLKDIQRSLDAETAIVEYWVSDESVIIWIVTRNDLHAKIVSIGHRELQRLLRGCRNQIAHHDEESAGKTLTQLRETLIAPVEEHIRGYKNLVVVPHRSLHFLPFQALMSRQGRFLVEDYIISYAPASSVLLYCLQRATPTAVSFLGLALGDLKIGNYDNLPGTKVEVELLSQLYPQSESKYGAACEETFVKNNARNFGYLHIATHGVFNEQEPTYSYLLLSPTDQDDGKLTVQEIFGIDIQSRLVTLSACETALGELTEGDELVGLSRAFIYAGSSAVLVSLWKVEDRSTALLMTRFHEYLAAGNTSAHALCLAQRDLIRKKITAVQGSQLRSLDLGRLTSGLNLNTINDPFFWAPFVLVGNGSVK